MHFMTSLMISHNHIPKLQFVVIIYIHYSLHTHHSLMSQESIFYTPESYTAVSCDDEVFFALAKMLPIIMLVSDHIFTNA